MAVGDAGRGEIHAMYVTATSRESLASFSGPICGHPDSRLHQLSCYAFHGWLRASPFSPSVECFCSAAEVQRGKCAELSGDTTSIFGVFKHLCTIITMRCGGEVARNRRLCSAVGAISPPAVRTAFPISNCQKPEATLLHHHYALNSPASCGFLENPRTYWRQRA